MCPADLFERCIVASVRQGRMLDELSFVGMANLCWDAFEVFNTVREERAADEPNSEESEGK